MIASVTAWLDVLVMLSEHVSSPPALLQAGAAPLLLQLLQVDDHITATICRTLANLSFHQGTADQMVDQEVAASLCCLCNSSNAAACAETLVNLSASSQTPPILMKQNIVEPILEQLALPIDNVEVTIDLVQVLANRPVVYVARCLGPV